MVGVEDVEGYEEEFVCGTENEECTLETGRVEYKYREAKEERKKRIRGFTELL